MSALHWCMQFLVRAPLHRAAQLYVSECVRTGRKFNVVLIKVTVGRAALLSNGAENPQVTLSLISNCIKSYKVASESDCVTRHLHLAEVTIKPWYSGIYIAMRRMLQKNRILK